jgi:hypothetical protein
MEGNREHPVAVPFEECALRLGITPAAGIEDVGVALRLRHQSGPIAL